METSDMIVKSAATKFFGEVQSKFATEFSLSEKVGRHSLLESRNIVHPLFENKNTNVYVESTEVPSSVWNNFAESGVNVSTTFKDAHVGAKDLLSKCGIHESIDEYQKTLDHLENALSFFRGVVTDTYEPSKKQEKSSLQFTAKIIAMKGSTMCPKYHVDNVAVRMNMTLVGPGVCYLQKEKDAPWKDRSNNHMRESSLKRANKAILKEFSDYKEVQANAGDLVLLMGLKWEKRLETHMGSRESSEKIPKAVIHKSPEIPPSQYRVLLTVDIKDAFEFDDSFFEYRKMKDTNSEHKCSDGCKH